MIYAVKPYKRSFEEAPPSEEGNKRARRVDAVQARVLSYRTSSGRLQTDQDAVQRGTEEIEAALQRNSKSIGLLYARTHMKALFRDVDLAQQLTEILTQDPNHIHSRILRAKVFLHHALSERVYLETAMQDIEHVIRLAPDEADAYLYRALGRGIKKEYELASVDLTHYKRLKPRSCEFHYMQGEILTMQGKIIEALEKYKACLRINPFHQLSLLRCGQIHSGLDNVPLAETCLTQLINFNPTHHIALSTLAELYYKNQNPRALEYANRALELCPEDKLALVVRAEIYRDQKKLEEASQDISNAIKLYGGTAEMWATFADIKYLEELDEEALAHADRALALNPEEPMALEIRGLLRLSRGEYAQALSDLKKCNNPSLWSDIEQQLAYTALALSCQRQYGLSLLYNAHLQPYVDVSVAIQSLLNLVQQTQATPKEDHRLAPIFADLEALREMSTPIISSLTPEMKGAVNEESLHVAKPCQSRYEYVARMLLSLQELDLNQKIIRKLNNKSPFLTNLSDQYAFALSGMIMHSDTNSEVNNPIGKFVDTLIETYEKAKRTSKLTEFFNQAFNPQNDCFGGRWTTLSEYAANLDFDLEAVPDIDPACLPLTNAGAFYRAFRTVQIRKMAADKNLSTAELRKAILIDTENPHQEPFFKDYCNAELFRKYLDAYPATDAIKACIPTLIENDLL